MKHLANILKIVDADSNLGLCLDIQATKGSSPNERVQYEIVHSHVLHKFAHFRLESD